jgi:hypothetical protein
MQRVVPFLLHLIQIVCTTAQSLQQCSLNPSLFYKAEDLKCKFS